LLFSPSGLRVETIEVILNIHQSFFDVDCKSRLIYQAAFVFWGHYGKR
jgi:hypothetical protein